MSTNNFVCRSRFPVSVEKLFAWHSRPGAFQRLMPPWEGVELIERTGGIEDGARTVIRVPWLGPLRRRWVAEHSGFIVNRQFIDTLVSGPFASFQHRHLFEADGPDASFLEDRIEYAL